jgi:hypothetical protein
MEQEEYKPTGENSKTLSSKTHAVVQGGTQCTPLTCMPKERKVFLSGLAESLPSITNAQYSNLGDPLLPPTDSDAYLHTTPNEPLADMMDTPQSQEYVAGCGLTNLMAKLLNDYNHCQHELLNENNRLRRGDVHLQAGTAKVQDKNTLSTSMGRGAKRT